MSRRPEEAQAAFQRAYELSPNDPDVIMALARVIPDQTEAIRLAQRAVRLNPSDPGLNHNLGQVYEGAGELLAALEAQRHALQLEPRRPFYLSIANIESQRGNEEEAISAMRTAEELAPSGGSTFSMVRLMNYYSRLNRSEDVVRIRDLLEQRDDERGVGHGFWALAYVALGDYDTALSEVEIAIEEGALADAIGLAFVRDNGLKNPVLDSDPRWLDIRERIAPDFTNDL
jgi:predicted Zn-dependent protease